MITFLLLLGLLLNGDFSDGLNHWQAEAGWSAGNGTADLFIDNTAGKTTDSALLCSDAYPLKNATRVAGKANLYETRPARGYLVPGVRWFDENNERMGDYAFGYDYHARQKWVAVGFDTDIPENARYAAFCFFGAAYGGKLYRASADNVTLKFTKE